MKKKSIISKLNILFVTIFLCHPVITQIPPQISEIDKIRIEEAFRLNKKFAGKVWKDLTKTPLAILLVNNEDEFLIGHPPPLKDFNEIGYDKILKNRVYWRKRQFNPAFLATFPAIQGSKLSTIVVGQAENTFVKTSTPWVITILHEHFHQFQDSQPNIYQDLLKLDLAGNDQTGMWMLNYPFPYKDKKINKAFSNLAYQLALTLETNGEKEFQSELQNYLKMRKEFNASLNEKDYKYLSFQFWKEGVARYTEYQIAKLAAENYKPTKEFKKLKDFQSYAEVAENLRKRIVEMLKTIRLDQQEREVVYPFGTAEALLLDKAKIERKPRYFSEKFYLDKYFERKRH